MKLLLIKLSSLGDLLHVFPALTELQKIDPQLEVTWVVESVFKEVPFWHPAVKHVIVAPLRQMKKDKLTAKLSKIVGLAKEIRKEQYDVVVDAQGLVKSAIFAKLARAKTKIGFGKGSAREAVWWLYDIRVNASWDWHAIARLEELFRAIPVTAHSNVKPWAVHPDYAMKPWQPNPSKILFFAHGTTWDTKHYPDELWRELAKIATAAGYTVWLPYSNDKELQRAEYLKVNDQVVILPKMSITAIKEKLYEVAGVVAVDTGLAHIAAALGVPTVTLYGPTDPAKIGTIGQHQEHLAAKFVCAPCEKKQCFHQERDIPPCPPCFRMLAPQEIFARITKLMAESNPKV